MQDLVSIIIPCYNAEKTISRTLFSVLEQDYKNFEIIIVDDGSCDNSLEKISLFSKVDKRIKVYSQKNSGVSVARNLGLTNANVEYIVFLDADDNYVNRNVISKMMAKLRSENADMCICNFTHPCFEIITKGDRVFNLKEKQDFIDFYSDFFLFGMPWNKITKKEYLTEGFIEGVKFNEDELYNIENLKNLNKVVFLDEVLHNYYCAPFNPKEKGSAVNSIYLKENFWETKSSIWHFGMQNHQFREKIIRKNFPNLYEDMIYVRSLDFFFWDLLLMLKNEVLEENIVKTCATVFESNLFYLTIKSKERYGLKLIKYPEKMLKDYVQIANIAFKDVKTGNKQLSVVRIIITLFVIMFFEKNESFNDKEFLSKFEIDYKTQQSNESKYIKILLNLF